MKERADIVLYKNKLTRSRNEASQLIESGQVTVDGKILVKPSQKIDDGSKIEIKTSERYVGRGAFKLIAALEYFKINPDNLTCLDVGSSTGGFTEVLLQRGAKKVYAVDVGSNQLSPSLRNNSKVVVMENTDIRKVNSFIEIPDLVVIDVSFISLEKILPKIVELIGNRGQIVALVKPQFEVGKENLGKQGLVKDIEWQNWALQKIKDFAKSLGLEVISEIDSPIEGGTGNKEFLIHLKNNSYKKTAPKDGFVY